MLPLPSSSALTAGSGEVWMEETTYYTVRYLTDRKIRMSCGWSKSCQARLTAAVSDDEFLGDSLSGVVSDGEFLEDSLSGALLIP